MKKIIFLTLLGFLICAAFIAPEKNLRKPLLTDYRDAYVGSYTCVRNSYHLRPSESVAKACDTINVAVSKDATDSIIIITIGGSLSKFKLKSAWLYSYPENNSHRGGKFFGGDSLALYQTNRGGGTNIVGKKI